MKRCTLLFSLCVLAACGGMDGSMEDSMEESSGFETVKQRLALFDFEVTESTDSATNPDTSAHSEVFIGDNETVMIGTCGITDASRSGDTFLRLFDASGNEVAFNDDNCSSFGSKLSYTGANATYTIRAGCFANTICSGTVAMSRRRRISGLDQFNFSVSNTNNASINTFNKQVYFNAGQVLRASTCATNATGASAVGNTYLRLFRNVGGTFTQVAANNDATTGVCGTDAEILYEVPSSGYYQVRAGCASNTACSGTLVIYDE